MNKWQKKFGVNVPLSVNLSRVDIYRPTIVEDIIRYVDSNNVPRDSFYIEITESAFVEDASVVIPVISKIRDSGFKVEIDDFGSGYSSFGALIDLPFDVLKIDMAFIRSMDKSPKVKEIIKMIINLSKTMDAITVAEGVEVKEQCDFLKESGCDVVQGYYLSKPLPKEDFEKLILATRERMQEDADRIIQGDIEIRPFEGGGRRQCDRCDYHSVCGFSTDIPGFSRRKLPPTRPASR